MESVAAFELKDTRLPVSRENPILEELRQLQREMGRVEAKQHDIETRLIESLVGPASSLAVMGPDEDDEA